MNAGKRAKRCVYCGAVTDQRACPSHRDLAALESRAMQAATVGEDAQATKGKGSR